MHVKSITSECAYLQAYAVTCIHGTQRAKLVDIMICKSVSFVMLCMMDRTRIAHEVWEGAFQQHGNLYGYAEAVIVHNLEHWVQKFLYTCTQLVSTGTKIMYTSLYTVAARTLRQFAYPTLEKYAPFIMMLG